VRDALVRSSLDTVARQLVVHDDSLCWKQQNLEGRRDEGTLAQRRVVLAHRGRLRRSRIQEQCRMQKMRRYNSTGDDNNNNDNDHEVEMAAGDNAGWRSVEKGPASLHIAEELVVA
jgi:hypothetical protein